MGRDLDIDDVVAMYPEAKKELAELRDELAAARARVAELEADKQGRSKIDPVTRLHNLCDALAEQRRESPYDEESWRLADEDNQRLRQDLAAARAERDKWHQAYQSMLDPIVRAKMLEPAPPMLAPVGMAEQVLLRERDELRNQLAAARALLKEARGWLWTNNDSPDELFTLNTRIDAVLDGERKP